jgi:hypothetical protein
VGRLRGGDTEVFSFLSNGAWTLANSDPASPRQIASGSKYRADWSACFCCSSNDIEKDPPVARGGCVYPANPVFFATMGRRYRVGVRLGL